MGAGAYRRKLTECCVPVAESCVVGVQSNSNECFQLHLSAEHMGFTFEPSLLQVTPLRAAHRRTEDIAQDTCIQFTWLICGLIQIAAQSSLVQSVGQTVQICFGC